MHKLRILLADDHETVREGLKAILNSQSDMEVIAEAVDGRTAVMQAAAMRPDVVVLDVTMPRLNGLKATESLRRCCPDVKVLTLTRHSDQGYINQLLRAGVSGYVLKQSRAAELLRAIRTVATGNKYLDPAIADRVVPEVGRRVPPSAAVAVESPALTAREEEVLRLVAWGYSNKEIASRLDLSVKTIETHKANAAHKLGLHSRLEIVRFALLQGWLQDT
jgi:DNA-binding NarL/FixJ family response regulator